jgi:biotin carboxyl carrier protein
LATSVEAPMVGKILKIEREAGSPVEEDDVVIVMEAMKMEIPVVAPVAGNVKEIKVTVGQAVEAGDTLAEIE